MYHHLFLAGKSKQRAGVYADDEQIDKLVVWRRAIHKGGQCIVHIKEIV